MPSIASEFSKLLNKILCMHQAHLLLLEACESDTYSILQRFISTRKAQAVVTVLQLVLAEVSPTFSTTKPSHAIKVSTPSICSVSSGA